MVREFTINSLLDSDIRVSDLTREELKRLAYGAKYFEFGYGYDATEWNLMRRFPQQTYNKQ